MNWVRKAPVHRSSFIDHRSNEGDGAFAYAYDQALGQRFFRAVRKLLAAVLDRYPASERTHLDLACGTGFVSRFFAERGFETTAVDRSMPMLSIARQRAARVVAADIRALPFRRTFGRITCLYDSLNHLQELEDLRAAVVSAAECMSRQSLFIFDVNDPEIYPAVWGM